jgi:cytochrome P450
MQTILYVVSKAIYNLFFHPLSRFPGLASHAVSHIPYCYRLIHGTLPLDMLELHQKYGDVVRIAPDQLAFSHPDAWKDIMGHRKSGDLDMERAKFYYRPIEDLPTNIINSNGEEHSRLRHQLSHGFSDKFMRDQEGLIGQYIDLFIQRLHENSAARSKPVNLAAWYDYTTFDVISDLAFGESFGSLKNSEYHSWIRMLFDSARIGPILQSLALYPFLKRLLWSMVPESAMGSRKKQIRLTKAKLLRRMEAGKERPDLIESLLKKKDDWVSVSPREK